MTGRRSLMARARERLRSSWPKDGTLQADRLVVSAPVQSGSRPLDLCRDTMYCRSTEMTPTTRRRDPEALLPLTPAMFHVLLSLAEDDAHGYAIMKEVAERTDGVVRLSTGTLYGLIKRLLSEGLIVASTRRPTAESDDERRRYYRLTDFGRSVALAEAKRHERILATARARLGPRRSGT
jgi:DNA-binding PadR family transcriptional regulator